MHRLKHSPIILAALLCLAGSCASPGGPPLDTLPAPTQLSRAAAWTLLEQHPGTAGKDYDPGCLLVSYRAGAGLPAGLAPAQPAALAAANSAPNPQLRTNSQYAAISAALAQRYGFSLRQQVYLGRLNFASFGLAAGVNGDPLLARLRSEAPGLIESAVYCPLRHAQYIPNDPDFFGGLGGKQWSHWLIGCVTAWDITRGDPTVVIADVDTGVRLTHTELSAQVIDPQTAFPTSTCDLANNDKSIEDTSGHGTFIAGMLCAQADDDKTIAGVAPLCKVLPIKISNDETTTLDKLVAGALLAGQLGAKVVNYSWGGSQNVPLEQNMVDTLTADGVLFVCAAGNDGVATDEYPSGFTNALSVGGTDKTDTRCSFSNYGPSVDIAAPGQNLKSCSANTDNGYDSNGEGTSFAAPIVAAAAGLLWSYRPELSLAQVRDALVNTGAPLSGFSNPIRRLDIAAALASVEIDETPTVSGVQVGPGSVFGAVAGQSSLPVAVLGASHVVRVHYRLDLAPLGSDSGEDLQADSNSPVQFQAQLDLSGLANQPCVLLADCYNRLEAKVSASASGLWIFNQRGDVNADGVVSPADLDTLKLHLGETSASPGWTCFADSDLDGKITEADAAALGYFYRSGEVPLSISGVGPLSGITGSQQSMQASLAGNGQLSYAWDFGGGATPNTSSLPAPTITLGPPGDYSATLTVSSEFSSDNFDFTLSVGQPPGLSAALVATPPAARPPADIGFDASGSAAPGGSIVSYDWSWDGDETYEDTTAVPTYTHQFTDPGDYTVRVRVTDNHAATAEATTPVHIADSLSYPNWGETVLGPLGLSDSTDTLRFATAQVAGCPALAWIWKDPNTSDMGVYVAVAKVAAPTVPSEWRVDKVYGGVLRESIGICDIDGEAAYVYGDLHSVSYGRYHGAVWSNQVLAATEAAGSNFASLANMGGKPFVLFKVFAGGPYGDDMAYAFPSNADPKTNSDWTVQGILGVPPVSMPIGYGIQLAVVGGRPMYTHLDDLGSLVCCFASSAAPGPAEWQSISFSGVHSDTDSFSTLLNCGGLPALVYNIFDGASWQLNYSYAGKLAPTQPGDWNTYAPDSAAEPLLTMAGTVAGHPAFARDEAGGTRIYLASTAQPASASAWLYIDAPVNFTSNRRLIDAGGLPGLIGVDADGSVVYRYPIP